MKMCHCNHCLNSVASLSIHYSKVFSDVPSAVGWALEPLWAVACAYCVVLTVSMWTLFIVLTTVLQLWLALYVAYNSFDGPCYIIAPVTRKVAGDGIKELLCSCQEEKSHFTIQWADGQRDTVKRSDLLLKAWPHTDRSSVLQYRQFIMHGLLSLLSSAKFCIYNYV